jgi:hypothetical protein
MGSIKRGLAVGRACSSFVVIPGARNQRNGRRQVERKGLPFFKEAKSVFE